MILVTVGTQIPFDRLIKAVDSLAPRLHRPVFAQVGVSSYLPNNIEYSVSLGPQEFETCFRRADVIVAHAGIGTVLGAMRHKKPIVIYPRRASNGEHRNDHQLATCAQLDGRTGIYVAYDDERLASLLLGPTLIPPDESLVAERRASFAAQLGAHIDRLSS